jgi:hypothetical protein
MRHVDLGENENVLLDPPAQPLSTYGQHFDRKRKYNLNCEIYKRPREWFYNSAEFFKWIVFAKKKAT